MYTDMPKDVHILELTPERVALLWKKFDSVSSGVFDDFTRNNPQYFMSMLTAPDSVWLERKDGNGVLYLTSVRPGLSATGHLLYWNKRLRGTEDFTLEVLRWLMETIPLQKINEFLPAYVHSGRHYAEKLGFKKEGCIRRWSMSNGKPFDMYVYGMTYEEALNGRIYGSLDTGEQDDWPGIRHTSQELVPGRNEEPTTDAAVQHTIEPTSGAGNVKVDRPERPDAGKVLSGSDERARSEQRGLHHWKYEQALRSGSTKDNRGRNGVGDTNELFSNGTNNDRSVGKERSAKRA